MTIEWSVIPGREPALDDIPPAIATELSIATNVATSNISIRITRYSPDTLEEYYSRLDTDEQRVRPMGDSSFSRCDDVMVALDGVQAMVVLASFDLEDDDVEGLNWQFTITASALRTLESYALGILTTIAVARISAGTIVDDSEILQAGRLITPQDLSTRLRLPSRRTEDLSQALRAISQRTPLLAMHD